MRLSNNTTRLRRDASARLGRRSTCGVAATLLVACAGLCWPSATRASGMERTIQGDDLRLVIDSRWAGCAYGGYLPIRLVLTNTGPSRMIAVTYSLGGGSQGAVEVRRQLLAESNTTQRFTLSVPLVSNQSYGVFRLYADGRRMDRFQLPFNTPDFQSSSDPRPSLIIISRDIVDCAAWEASIPRAATSHSPTGEAAAARKTIRSSRPKCCRRNGSTIRESMSSPFRCRCWRNCRRRRKRPSWNGWSPEGT